MGTNFYRAARLTGSDEPAYIEAEHIGKRSAAGWYCYDCDEALVVGGARNVHRSEHTLDACPKCGKGKADTGHNPAMVELGFEKHPADRPRGVTGASSFRWATDPHAFRRLCEERLDEVLVVDEYGRALTGGEFLRMLRAGCPIQFFDSIGTEFS